MEWLLALESSAIGNWMRSSGWAYPFVHWVHVVGLVLLVGSMLFLDLRLLGAARSAITVRAADALLTPFAVVGLLLMLGSGVLLFAADAQPLVQNPLFLPKLALVALGIVNALVFRRLWLRPAMPQDTATMPSGARLQAAASLCIWVVAATFGRFLAYV